MNITSRPETVPELLASALCQSTMIKGKIELIDYPGRDDSKSLEISTRILAMRLSASQLIPEIESIGAFEGVAERLERYEALLVDAHQSSAGLSIAMDAAMAYIRVAVNRHKSQEIPEGFHSGFGYFIEQHDALMALIFDQDAPLFELRGVLEQGEEEGICALYQTALSSSRLQNLFAPSFAQGLEAMRDLFAAAAISEGTQAKKARMKGWILAYVMVAGLTGQSMNLKNSEGLQQVLAPYHDDELIADMPRVLRKIERNFRL